MNKPLLTVNGYKGPEFKQEIQRILKIKDKVYTYKNNVYFVTDNRITDKLLERINKIGKLKNIEPYYWDSEFNGIKIKIEVLKNE